MTEVSMSAYRNITLSRIAARRQTSVSRLVAMTLEEMAAREDAYARAREKHLKWLEHAADLGTNGHITWPRESLHER
jgi:hypothetical protein